MSECACWKFYEIYNTDKIQGQRQRVSIAQCGAVATATPETSMGESLPNVV